MAALKRKYDPLHRNMTPEQVSKMWRDWFETVRPKDGSDWCDECRDWHMPEQHNEADHG